MAPGRASGSPPYNANPTVSIHDNQHRSRLALSVNNPGLISHESAMVLIEGKLLNPWETGKINTHADFADMDTAASLSLLQENIRDLAKSEYAGKVSLEDIVNGQSLNDSGLDRVFSFTTPQMRNFILDPLKNANGIVDLQYTEKAFGDAAAELKLPAEAKITQHKFDISDPHQLYILTSMVLKTVHRDNLAKPFSEALFKADARKKQPEFDSSPAAVTSGLGDYKDRINTAIVKNELFYDGYFSDKFLPSGAVALKRETLLSSPDFNHANQAYIDTLVKKAEEISSKLGFNKDPEFQSLHDAMLAADAAGKKGKDMPQESYWTPEKALYMLGVMTAVRSSNIDAILRAKLQNAPPGRLSVDQRVAGEKAEIAENYDRLEEAVRVNNISYPLGLMAEAGTQKKTIDFLNTNSPLLSGQPLPANTSMSDPRAMIAMASLPQDFHEGFKNAAGLSIEKTLFAHQAALKGEDLAKFEELSSRMSIVSMAKFINRNFVGEGKILKEKIPEDGNATDARFIQGFSAVTKQMQAEIMKPAMLAKLGDSAIVVQGRVLLKIPAINDQGEQLADDQGKPVLAGVELTSEGHMMYTPSYNLVTQKYYVVEPGPDGTPKIREGIKGQENGETVFKTTDPQTGRLVTSPGAPLLLNPTREALKILKEHNALGSGILRDFERLTSSIPGPVLDGMNENIAMLRSFEKTMGPAIVDKMKPDDLQSSFKTLTAKQMLSTVLASNTLPGVSNFNVGKDPANITDKDFIRAAHDTFATTEKFLTGPNAKLLAAAFTPAEKAQLAALSEISVSGQYNAHTGQLLSQLRDKMFTVDPASGEVGLNPEFVERARAANSAVTPEYLHTMAAIVNNLSNVYTAFNDIPESGIKMANIAMQEHHNKTTSTASLSSSGPATKLNIAFSYNATVTSTERPAEFPENPAIAAERKAEFAVNKDMLGTADTDPALEPAFKPGLGVPV